jgi:Mrp family chromosome partitioning ATPase
MQTSDYSSQLRAIPPQKQTASVAPQCLQLLLACARPGGAHRHGGVVVAFTSANPGEGVSHVVNSFASELVSQTGKLTLVVDAQRLQRLRVADYMNMPRSCVKTEMHNLWTLPMDDVGEERAGSRPQAQVDAWQNDPEFGFDRLQALSAVFDYTLINCPSIKNSYEAAMLAPGVDGVVLVVEADRTKRDQIQRAQRTIEMANGNLLGLVLNKRRYVVPRWLYRKL